jgi:hypothetical protein
MLFTRFLNIINSIFPPSLSPNLIENLSRLNPDKFYLENVRSVLNVPYNKAKSICEEAVKQGIVKECVEVLCPDGSVAKSAENELDLPKIVQCWEEIDGDYEEKEYETLSLEKQTYYRFTTV